MRPGGGKSKGGGFERVCCEKLSLWLSKGERDDLLCRTVGSGGQFTTAAQRGRIRGLAGDLRAQDGELAFKFFDKFVVECKFWRDLELINFLLKKGLLYDALEKVKKEALQTEKPGWMLLAKQNNRPSFLFLPVESVLGVIPYIPGISYHILFDGTVYMYILDEFLASVDAERMLYAYESKRS